MYENAIMMEHEYTMSVRVKLIALELLQMRDRTREKKSATETTRNAPAHSSSCQRCHRTPAADTGRHWQSAASRPAARTRVDRWPTWIYSEKQVDEAVRFELVLRK